MFVARDKELLILEKLIKRDKSSLAVIYGRRRIGKTEIIRHFIDKNKLLNIQVTGVDGATSSEQVFSFLRAIKRFCEKNGKTFNTTKTKKWKEAFADLEDCLDMFDEKRKKVIFFDEFPWLDSKRSGFRTAFAHFWNDFCERRKDLIVIVCGSAASYMINKIIKDTKTLNNRNNTKIHLEAFYLDEVASFIRKKGLKYSNKSIVDIYMSLGGVAFYLENLQNGLQPDINIHNLCFEKNGLLLNEYESLYKSLFEKAQTHKKIMDLLVTKWSGFIQSEILKGTKIDSPSTINLPLQELEQSGFISSYTKFGQSNKDKIYRASDCFSYFYNFWIKNNRGKNWTNLLVLPEYRSWKGYAFENICLLHIDKIKDLLGISGIDTNSHYWSYKPTKDSGKKGVQIDILLEHANNSNNVDIIECKYYKGKFSMDKSEHGELQRKIEVFQEVTNYKYNVRLILITTEGVVENENYFDIVNKSFTIDDIIKTKS